MLSDPAIIIVSEPAFFRLPAMRKISSSQILLHTTRHILQHRLQASGCCLLQLRPHTPHSVLCSKALATLKSFFFTAGAGFPACVTSRGTTYSSAQRTAIRPGLSPLPPSILPSLDSNSATRCVCFIFPSRVESLRRPKSYVFFLQRDDVLILKKKMFFTTVVRSSTYYLILQVPCTASYNAAAVLQLLCEYAFRRTKVVSSQFACANSIAGGLRLFTPTHVY